MQEKIERCDPDDILAHYELLRMQINMVLPLVRRIANCPCEGFGVDKCTCISCDAKKFLSDIGVKK